MPAVQFHCPRCTGLFQVDDSLAGLEVACPHCQGAVTVPGMQPIAQSPPVYEPPPQNYAPIPPANTSLLALNCPVCQGMFQVDGSMSNQQVLCPHCQTPVLIPPIPAPQFESAPYAPPPLHMPPSMPAPATPPVLPPTFTPPPQLPPEIKSPEPSKPTSKERQQPVPVSQRATEEKTNVLSSPPVETPILPPVNVADLLPPGAANVQNVQPQKKSRSSAAGVGQEKLPTSHVSTPVPQLPVPQSEIKEFAPQQKTPSPATPEINHLLPPGVELPPNMSTHQPADTLLPPGVTGVLPPSVAAHAATMERVPLPAQIPETTPGMVTLPSATGQTVKVRDAVKTIRHKGQIVELKQLTAEEKSKRRTVRNIVLMVVCVAILFGVMVIFLR